MRKLFAFLLGFLVFAAEAGFGSNEEESPVGLKQEKSTQRRPGPVLKKPKYSFGDGEIAHSSELSETEDEEERGGQEEGEIRENAEMFSDPFSEEKKQSFVFVNTNHSPLARSYSAPVAVHVFQSSKEGAESGFSSSKTSPASSKTSPIGKNHSNSKGKGLSEKKEIYRRKTSTFEGADDDDDLDVFEETTQESSLQQALYLIYNPRKGFVTTASLHQHPLSRDDYFGLTGVFQPWITQLSKKIRDLSKVSKIVPEVFLCYAWKKDKDENTLWQTSKIAPMRDFLRSCGIHATMDIKDNDQGDVESYRTTLDTVDAVVVVVNQDFLEIAKEWKKWREDLIGSVETADRTSGLSISLGYIEKQLQGKRNIWKELEAIQQRLEKGMSSQLIFPLLMEGVTTHDVETIWPQGFIARDISDAFDEFKTFPVMAVSFYKSLFSQTHVHRNKGLKECQRDCEHSIQSHQKKSERQLLENMYKARYEKNYRTRKQVISFYETYDNRVGELEFGANRRHGPVRRIRHMFSSTSSDQDDLLRGFMRLRRVNSDSQDSSILDSPPTERKAFKSSKEETPMEVFRQLRSFSFSELMDFANEDKSKKALGLWHLAMAEGFEFSFLANGSRRKACEKCEDSAVLTGEYAFRAYSDALDVFVMEKDMRLFSAHVACSMGRLVLEGCTQAGQHWTTDQRILKAKEFFKEAIQLDPEYLYSYYELAKIYFYEKQNKKTEDAIEGFTRCLKSYSKKKERVMGQLDGGFLQGDADESLIEKGLRGHKEKLMGFIEEIKRQGVRAGKVGDELDGLPF